MLSEALSTSSNSAAINQSSDWTPYDCSVVSTFGQINGRQIQDEINPIFKSSAELVRDTFPNKPFAIDKFPKLSIVIHQIFYYPLTVGGDSV